MFTTLSFVILIFSVIIHEVSHGYMAERLGDPTARLQGRLTLNPLKHLDPIGSIIVPIVTALGGVAFGWAKPVPYNPYNLKNRRSGELLIALAGPLSNIFIALVFGLVIRYAWVGIATPFIVLSYQIVMINIVLAVFNLIPLPPLDGSKVLFFLLPHRLMYIRRILEMYSYLFVLIVVIFLWQLVAPIVPLIMRLFTGIDI